MRSVARIWAVAVATHLRQTGSMSRSLPRCFRGRALLAAIAWLSVAACGGGGAISPSGTAVEKSALGSNRCPAEGEEEKLFLVEWDATDLSSFESKAGRDVVFVKYDNCQMKVLHGCSDDGIAGRYGSYKPPEMTSGASRGSERQDGGRALREAAARRGDVRRQLRQGKALSLGTTCRDHLRDARPGLRPDLKGNPRCSGATHFVASYNLGAFELSSSGRHQGRRRGLGLGAVGGGAKRSDRPARSSAAETSPRARASTQYACKVPIRVLLRPVAAGARPASPTPTGSDPAAAAAPADAAAATNAAMAMMHGAQLGVSAEQKLGSGDAQGCLVDLDRATQGGRSMVDPQRRRTQQRA